MAARKKRSKYVIPTPQVPALRAMLRQLHKNEDIDGAVDRLMQGHTSPRALPEMSVKQLSTQLPLRTAELVHQLPSLARAMLRSDYPAHPIIGCMADAGKYLYSSFLGQPYEQCRMLMLRKNRYLIREALIQTGTLDSVPFYNRNIIDVALQNDAEAIVIAHNHPGGTPIASDEDIQSTYFLIEALRPLEIPLLDHLIFTETKVISIRECSHIKESFWLSQPGNCPAFLKTWLNPPKKPAAKRK